MGVMTEPICTSWRELRMERAAARPLSQLPQDQDGDPGAAARPRERIAATHTSSLSIASRATVRWTRRSRYSVPFFFIPDGPDSLCLLEAEPSLPAALAQGLKDRGWKRPVLERREGGRCFDRISAVELSPAGRPGGYADPSRSNTASGCSSKSSSQFEV